MTRPFVRVGGNGTAQGRSLWLWCPACMDAHRIVIGVDGAWTWDGNEEAPTISPSLFVRYGKVAGGEERCHSFVRSGQWQFLSDCTHEFAGQTVPMMGLPDWLIEDVDSDHVPDPKEQP